jgi:hypothetical protein
MLFFIVNGSNKLFAPDNVVWISEFEFFYVE